MDVDERDIRLLALLDPDDRCKIEEVVDEIIDENLPAFDVARLEAVANAFQHRGMALPNEDKVIAWQIAAALRLRARVRH